MNIDERLLRHLYAYDRTLPLLATSEPEPVLDLSTRTLVEDVRRERVTFGSTHDERMIAWVHERLAPAAARVEWPLKKLRLRSDNPHRASTGGMPSQP